MASIFSGFTINGVISTDKTVMQNLNELCTACGAWMTYDIADGKWSVIINSTGSSIASFDDSNIIGSINVSGTGVNELYNQATIEFPHKDLRDQTDYIDLAIPTADRFANELDNRINIRTDLVNDPVQAQYLATVELKQSRVDKVITFRTDYSKIGLKAGDLIDVTSEQYSYTNKVFRITRVEESDDDVLGISITALEYDANVYSTAGLTREVREKKTGIIPKATNTAVANSENASLTVNLTSSLNNVGNAALITSLLSAFSSNIGGGGGSVTALNSFTVSSSPSNVQTVFNAYAGTATLSGGFGGNTTLYVSLPFTLSSTVANLLFIVNTPIGGFDYQFYNGSSNQIRTGLYAYIPCIIDTYYNGVAIQQNTVDWQTANVIASIPNAPAGNYEFRVYPLPTYDLDTSFSRPELYPYNFQINPQANGGGVSVTALAFFY